MSAEHRDLPSTPQYYFYERGDKRRILGLLGFREPDKRLLTAEGTEAKPVFLYEDTEGGSEVEYSAIIDEQGRLVVRKDWDGRYEDIVVDLTRMDRVPNLKSKIRLFETKR